MEDMRSSDTASTSSASCDFSSPPSRERKKRDGGFSKNEGVKSRRQSSKSSDTDYNWESNSKKSEKQTQISNWTKEKAEAYGLFYEKEASTFTDFYDLFGSCGGKSRYGFTYPLDGEEKTLLDSLLNQTNEMIEKHGVEMKTDWDWAVTADWPYVFTKCRNTVRILTQNLSDTFKPASGNHTRSYVALVQFYMALQDYVQEEIWRSSSLNGPSCVPEGAYTELCAKFFAIFLLMLRRGEVRKSMMMIKGVAISSIPDLRLTISTSPSPSLFVVEVVEVKKSALVSSTPFNIHQALDKRVLGQHAGELLLDFHLSVFKDLQAVFGIICMRTSLIFTCLKLTTKHYQYISKLGEDVVILGMEVDDCSDLSKDESEREDEDEDEEIPCRKKKSATDSENADIKSHSRKSGTIFYTKPYNYLVSKERREIMEFLFWLGINCERVSVSV